METVEKMSIRERAMFAYLDRLQTDENFTISTGIQHLIDLLQDPDAELTVGKIRSSGNDQEVEIEVEDLKFKVSVSVPNKKSMNSNAGLIMEETKVVIRVYRGTEWKIVTDLADIGSVFKDDNLPEL